MSSSRITKGALILGIFGLLFQVVVASGLLPYGVTSALGFVQPIIDFWWIFAGIGILGIINKRSGINIPSVRTESPTERQSIIQSTNWVRESESILRYSFGSAILLSSVIMFVVSRALGKSTLSVFWILFSIAGIILIIFAWKRENSIVTHHTQTISIRAPDLFAVHSFHVALRQAAENLGYQIRENTSPSQGGRSSANNQSIFHANGGFKGRKRPIEPSNILFEEAAENKYLSIVATTATLGVFSTLLGITILTVPPTFFITALTVDSVNLEPSHVIGMLLLISGIAITAYDYFKRTREWGEIYCVEEGTIYNSTINLHEKKMLLITWKKQIQQ